jgi:hypothetical protein
VSGHDLRDDYDDEPRRERHLPDRLVQWLAGAVEAFGRLQLLCSVVGLLAGTVWVFEILLDPQVPGRVRTAGISIILASLWGIGWNALVVAGARDMRRYQRYRLVMLAAVLSALPIPFVYFAPCSFPVSIGAIIVLLAPDVRARFEAVARGKMNAASPEARDARRTDAS